MEANDVIGLRLSKMASGGVDASAEARLMVEEKWSAMFEASRTILGGGSAGAVVGRYREHVAEISRRLQAY